MTKRGKASEEIEAAERPVPAAAPTGPFLPTVEQLAQRRRWHGVPNADRHPDYWKFAATKAFKNWPQGFEMSEADFDAAVHEMETQPIR